MEKVICDICGSEFEETLSQCPICGCAKKEANAENAESAYVKGGRFSKSNVRRRLKPETAAAASDSVREYVKNNDERKVERKSAAERNEEEDEQDAPRNNRPLLLVVILLLLAIIAVSVYIVIAFSDPYDSGDATNNTTISIPNIDDDGPCTSVSFVTSEIKLDKTSPNKKLTVIKEPVNTVDELHFESSDPSLIAVDDNGNLTALKKGAVTITVTCGMQSATVTVVSEYEIPTTAPTTQPTTQTTTKPTQSPDSKFEFHSGAYNVTPYQVKVIYDYLNVRKGPDTSKDNKVHSLTKGEIVTVTAKYADSKREWGLTEYGWISLETQYVTVVNS